ncbi:MULTISPECIES: MerR family transcriptional regulator [Bacillaceae]|uniref:MerR family transcriptional regulator n=1 Tax=Evansella alkalicola TaxID=745819 RepID=A0ABS6JR99_9BACI|nr:MULTISPECIES: MerR family transcriptional regulator [Bacillaceae]MBU9720787.1 MerR family transcriptional regulator [Bacillus alkalicola]
MEAMTIRQLAEKYKISTRTLRYYEELGIIQPERPLNHQRLYRKKDETRLRLILRGKKFGFSLDQIKEMITLFDEDRSGVKQLEKTVEYGKRRVLEVEERIQELEELREDMQNYLSVFEGELKKLKGEK